MTQMVAPPDLELFLCGYLRSSLGVEVGNKHPDDWAQTSDPLVVVRDDGGAKTGPVTFDRSVGVTVYAGARQDSKASGDLARRAFAALTCPGIARAAGSPIAAVIDDGCNGPYATTDDHDASAHYLTAEYSVVGEIIETDQGA